MQTHAAVLGSPGCDMRRAEVRDTPQAASIEKPRHTAFDFHNAVPPQLLECAIEMDDAEAQGVRNDFLGQRQRHEIICRNPDLGERKYTTTITAGSAARLSADFSSK